MRDHPMLQKTSPTPLMLRAKNEERVTVWPPSSPDLNPTEHPYLKGISMRMGGSTPRISNISTTSKRQPRRGGFVRYWHPQMKFFLILNLFSRFILNVSSFICYLECYCLVQIFYILLFTLILIDHIHEYEYIYIYI